MEVLMRDLYCYQCSLQFDKKYIFDVHLSFVHGEKLDIKEEPEPQPSVIHETKELEINHQEEENGWKNESKRRKVSIQTSSDHEEKKKFKCDICDVNFGCKGTLNRHVTTVHDGKKRFKCDICYASFGYKSNLNRHVATVHEGKKQYKRGICKAEFTSKQARA